MHTASRRITLGIAAALTFLLVGIWPAPRATAAGAEDPPRIVAIGDIHGHFEGFVAILREAGLIDEQRRWTGGRAVLVQTGDYTDRGAGVRDVFDLLMALEDQAERAGGRVVTLLGNHEVMNLLGELRDVTPEICETFADERSEARRERAWRRHEQLAAQRMRQGGEPPAGLPAHPRGMDGGVAAGVSRIPRGDRPARQVRPVAPHTARRRRRGRYALHARRAPTGHRRPFGRRDQ
jgi:hypothetical protein